MASLRRHATNQHPNQHGRSMKKIKFRDAELAVNPIDIDRRAMFVRWFKLQGIESLRMLRPDLADHEYHALLSIWLHDVASGSMDWGTPRCTLAILSPSGAKYLALLALNGPAQRPVGMDVIEALWNDKDAWDAYCEATVIDAA